MNGPKPKPWIEAIAPYTPGKRPATLGGAKLSANENPLGTSPAAERAMAEARGVLSRYPDPEAIALREAIAEHHGLDPARVICGTGSDELLHLAASAYAGPGDAGVFQRYGFSVYPIALRRVGATPVEAEDHDYGADVEAMLGAVDGQTRLIYLANPNNPTGSYLNRKEISRLHGGMPSDCLLVLDQAYAEYLGEDDGGLALAAEAPNVFVTRTFSKIYGLAAERIGWGYGAAPVIAALNKVRAPFNVTTAGQAAAIAALGDQDFVADSRAHNARWRDWLASEIAALGNAGLRALPSRANFLLIVFDGPLSAERVFEGLRERGYVTRWLPGQGLPAALRITIGTEAETRGVAAALTALAEAGF